jgi:methionyl-tRNA formyltransferase
LTGDAETGVTIQRMVQMLDAGPILAQAKTPIGPRETFSGLHDRLSMMGAELLVQSLLHSLQPIPQMETGVTLCKKLARASGMVDPKTMTAAEIDRRVRALHPWPGVTLPLGNDALKILASDLQQTKGSAALPCKDQTMLYLVNVQPAGGKPMTGEAWMHGQR